MDILIEYERLYYLASIMVGVIGFLTCFCIALIGLLFRNREPEPIDWPRLRVLVKLGKADIYRN
jgi:hypothetical protein